MALLDDDEELRRQLLEQTASRVGGIADKYAGLAQEQQQSELVPGEWGVDLTADLTQPAQPEVDVDFAAKGPELPPSEMAAGTTPGPQLDQLGEAIAFFQAKKKQPQVDAFGSIQPMGDDKYSRVGQAIYHAQTGEPLPDSYFARADDRSMLLQKAMLDRFGKQKGSIDPNDPEHVSAREYVRVRYPRFAKALGPALNSMLRPQLEKMFNSMTAGEGLEQRQTEFDVKADQFDQKFEQQKVQFKARQESDRLKQEAIQKRYVGSALEKFGDDIKPDMSMVSLLQQIDDETAVMGPDGKKRSLARGFADPKMAPELDKAMEAAIRGDYKPMIDIKTKVKALLPFGAGSQITEHQKAAIQGKVAALFAEYVHQKAGSALTNSEMARLSKVLHDQVFSTPELQAAAVDMLRRLSHTRLKTREAAYHYAIPEEQWMTYRADGGFSSRMPLFDDLHDGGPAPSAVQPGQPTQQPRPQVQNPRQGPPTPLDMSTEMQEPPGHVIKLQNPGAPPPATPAAPTGPVTKQINGKTYFLKPNGKWAVRE